MLLLLYSRDVKRGYAFALLSRVMKRGYAFAAVEQDCKARLHFTRTHYVREEHRHVVHALSDFALR